MPGRVDHRRRRCEPTLLVLELRGGVPVVDAAAERRARSAPHQCFGGPETLGHQFHTVQYSGWPPAPPTQSKPMGHLRSEAHAGNAQTESTDEPALQDGRPAMCPQIAWLEHAPQEFAVESQRDELS